MQRRSVWGIRAAILLLPALVIGLGVIAESRNNRRPVPQPLVRRLDGLPPYPGSTAVARDAGIFQGRAWAERAYRVVNGRVRVAAFYDSVASASGWSVPRGREERTPRWKIPRENVYVELDTQRVPWGGYRLVVREAWPGGGAGPGAVATVGGTAVLVMFLCLAAACALRPRAMAEVVDVSEVLRGSGRGDRIVGTAMMWNVRLGGVMALVVLGLLAVLRVWRR